MFLRRDHNDALDLDVDPAAEIGSLRELSELIGTEAPGATRSEADTANDRTGIE
ncbi:hypothetical protein [Halorubrum sp. Boch-26]|uniref:hypothetical protein n=1 Tax=Halorubrum sp. Boch-26 TaxID=2994426 RepID=UPI00246976EA|nr:hypothetical protein [Halorubrum sp. Boch-26]